jgi:hypothetical protein
MKKPKQTNAEWLAEQVGYAGDDCLQWPFGRSSGYGMVKYEGEITYAHRVMCRLAHGEPPTPKHEAAHSCGKGHEGCINPNHLSWKTHAENQRDRIAHGTIQAGHKRKLSFDDALKVRALRGKLSQREIGEMFGITRANVSYIQLGKTYRDRVMKRRDSSC